MIRPHFLIQLKRAWFEAIRRNRLGRLVQDIDNYLTNVEILRGLPVSGQPALVLSPHPDDESIGCGGTLALLSRRGDPVDVAFLSAGAAGANGGRGPVEREARAAADLLGVRTLHFLDGEDGDLHLQPWLADPVLKLLQAQHYPLVFCPWPYDGHSDHAATFRILREALGRASYAPEVWLYEVWAPLVANRVVDIDAVIDLKCRAIDTHTSQSDNIDYRTKFLALARYRSLICRPSDHAEAFFVCAPGTLQHFGRAQR